MRFLVDERTGPAVAQWLWTMSREVFSGYDSARGMPDQRVLEKAYSENWILITNDKDFGEKVFRDQHPHHGVVLLRLVDERPASQVATLARLLDGYKDRLGDAFVVVT